MKPSTWFFLRGLVRESGHWEKFLNEFRARFPSRKVVTLDLPGNGTRFHERSPTSIDEMVDRLRPEYLAKREGDSHLCAISLGAMVGLAWMHRYPQDFSSATLLNTSLRGLNSFSERLLPSNYFQIVKILFSSPLAREKRILAMTSHRPELWESTAAEWATIHVSRPVSRINGIRQILAAMKFRPPSQKPAAKILLLYSEGDQLVSPRCSEKIAALWNVEKRRHPTAGHDIPLDDPDWVLAQLT